MKNDPIENAIALLDGVDAHSTEGRKQLQKALQSKFNLVVAKAARITGDAIQTELTPDLAFSFARFLSGGKTPDKGCVALTRIARALVKLDYDDSDLFRRGMLHVQMEPVWGGSEDTAAELRATCAMGLANTRDPGKLQPLVDLLVDREWPARAGALKALAAVGSDSAVLLLRYKALLGDKEPEVLAECLNGLLEVGGPEALPLVVGIAESKQQEVRETALLALGASRRPDAIEWLQARFERVADSDTKKCIVLALAGSRAESAITFVLNVIRTGSASLAKMALGAMTVYKSDPRLRDDVIKAAETRSDGAALLHEANL